MQEPLDEVEFSLRSVWRKFVDHPDEGMDPDVATYLAPEDAESIATLAFMQEVAKCKISEAHKILGPSTLSRVADALRVARVGGGFNRETARLVVDALTRCVKTLVLLIPRVCPRLPA